MKRMAVAALLAVAAPASAAEPIIGKASVIDGDTIEIHGQRIRLYGIDAPEHNQTCTKGGHEWRCGQEAALALSGRIGDATVTCEDRGRDKYKRVLSVCTVPAGELNAWMVRKGLALAYRRYSADYIGAEQGAQKAEAGMWAGQFVMPWEWRHGRR